MVEFQERETKTTEEEPSEMKKNPMRHCLVLGQLIEIEVCENCNCVQ